MDHRLPPILCYHDNSVAKALSSLFPEMSISSPTDLASQQSKRTFFENYARENGFDPLHAAKWYLQYFTKIRNTGRQENVVKYYSMNIPKTLAELFPEIGLDQSKFFVWWKNPANRRRALESYASELGFDPLIAQNWYKQSSSSVKFYMKDTPILRYHSNNVAKTLVDLFPDIGLRISKFDNTSLLWKSKVNRKRFFEDFARENGFEPLIPENWYSQSKMKIRNSRKADSVLKFHGNNVAKALLDLFPAIGLDKAKLTGQGRRLRAKI
eukprot:Phypoly_transcript_08418.p1 GENE.Phypoly_transcript_08418~~Phypoly_transcript_08418.p1  ORF type:complete len:268 (+),score=33.53 Phypoly_transcript_08418:1-804(+)